MILYFTVITSLRLLNGCLGLKMMEKKLSHWHLNQPVKSFLSVVSIYFRYCNVVLTSVRPF